MRAQDNRRERTREINMTRHGERESRQQTEIERDRESKRERESVCEREREGGREKEREHFEKLPRLVYTVYICAYLQTIPFYLLERYIILSPGAILAVPCSSTTVQTPTAQLYPTGAPQSDRQSYQCVTSSNNKRSRKYLCVCVLMCMCE